MPTTQATDLTRETEVQRAVMRLYAAAGCEVARFSDHTPGRWSRITKGWPDLYIFAPRKRVTWMHETKTPKGVQSAAQGTIQGWAESCDLDYVIGGELEARLQLERLGLIEKL